MRVLLADGDLGRWGPGHAGGMDSAGLAVAYAYPVLAAGQVWVRANFISTLDGAATGDDGRSGSINTGADRDVFALLRALSDVILIGAGTARVEGYRRATVQAPRLHLRQGRPAHPTIAVFSRSGDVPPSHQTEVAARVRDRALHQLHLQCEPAFGTEPRDARQRHSIPKSSHGR